MFDPKAFTAAITAVAEHYEKSAPTVDAWCDWLVASKDVAITLADVRLLRTFHDERPQANYAANMLYHHQYRMGRDTTGHAGY